MYLKRKGTRPDISLCSIFLVGFNMIHSVATPMKEGLDGGGGLVFTVH